MLDIRLDRTDKTPLYIQIREEIIRLITSGVLIKGNQLPSSRALAKQLSVNRTTVYQAYRELWSLGYTESRPGSYSVVRDRKKTGQPVIPDSPLIDWNGLINQSDVPVKTVPVPDSSLCDFRTFSPASTVDAADNFRKCLNDVLKSKGKDLLLYGDPFGYKPLREYIAELMTGNEIDADVERVLITDGAQNALDLICKLFQKPRWKIITAEPTYSEALTLFRYYGAEILSIPIGSEGIDTEELEKLLDSTARVSFLYTMPNFQNPTGITSSRQNREKILELCEKAGIPIIEDGFSQDMRGTILPIKSMDRNGIVLYVGTFSKVLFPGIRTGWINGNTMIVRKLAALQYMTSVSCNHIMQAALERFSRLGYYDLHLKKIHRFYRERMEKALTVLHRNYPGEAGRFTTPSGGFYLWFTMSDHFPDEGKLVAELKNKGILITGGSAFTVRSGGVYLRMSIAQGSEKKLEDGLKNFCAAIKQLL